MDASAYLRRQGWRGDGHSLDQSNRGIRKPLLVAKKVDALGVGLSKHQAVSDQWWLRAFDEGLKSLGTGQESLLAKVQKHGVNRGDLYGRFVKGERIAGSIGQTPQSSENEAESGRETPLEVSGDTAMAIDIPPAEKLERVVGNQTDQNSRDAMMHLLQNPEEAPASMRTLLDKKRKRAEQPAEKRARRKIESEQRVKAKVSEKRKEARADGTWNAEKEEDKRQAKNIERQTKEFILEAQKRGIIPLGPNEVRKGIVPYSANESTDAAQDEVQQVFQQVRSKMQAGLKSSGESSSKKDKYARERIKRELKRAAKAYLLGDTAPHEMTANEKKAKKDAKKSKAALSKSNVAKVEAENLAMTDARIAQKAEAKRQRKAEKAERSKMIDARDAALKAGKTLEEFHAEWNAGAASSVGGQALSVSASNIIGTTMDVTRSVSGTDQSNRKAHQNGVDEVALGVSKNGRIKRIPGQGAVDRYPTKSEKKERKIKALAVQQRVPDEEVKIQINSDRLKNIEAEQMKVDKYRAMKHGMPLDNYKSALVNGDIHSPYIEKQNIAPAKLAEYQKRAAQKGIVLDEYVRKRAKKTAEKKSEKLGNPYQQDMAKTEDRSMDYIEALPEQSGSSDEVAFIVDTVGDNGAKPLAILDTAGDDKLVYKGSMPVPLDPRIWEGKVVKDLPKEVRKARRAWLAARRQEKKARVNAEGKGKSRPANFKPKGVRKVEAREAFVRKVLFESRNALKQNGSAGGSTTIDGVENVPLVKVESTAGIYPKSEVALARTVARRVLRNVKREEKAANGKGKGWKKRERSDKEATRNRGISGSTNQARFATGANRDLLL